MFCKEHDLDQVLNRKIHFGEVLLKAPTKTFNKLSGKNGANLRVSM